MSDRTLRKKSEFPSQQEKDFAALSPATPKIRSKDELPTIVLQSLNEISTTVKDLKLELVKMHEKVNTQSDQINSQSKQIESQSEQIISLTNIISELRCDIHKREESVKSEEKDAACSAIKVSMERVWKDLLNRRSLTFEHYHKCLEKAKLYEEWITTSPEYIPLKFRPKAIVGNNKTVEKLRVEDAKKTYRTDVQLLMTYAASHQERIQATDELIVSAMKEHTEDESHIELLKQWWEKDVSEKEGVAKERWQKRKQFLIEKKEEYEKNPVASTSKQKTSKEISPVSIKRAATTTTKSKHSQRNPKNANKKQDEQQFKPNNTKKVSPGQQNNNKITFKVKKDTGNSVKMTKIEDKNNAESSSSVIESEQLTRREVNNLRDSNPSQLVQQIPHFQTMPVASPVLPNNNALQNHFLYQHLLYPPRPPFHQYPFQMFQ